MLFEYGKNAGTSFSLIHRKAEDLYDKIKTSHKGGPSIVTTRYHEVGQTYIREDKPKPCKSIAGYDFNNLYLHAIGQDMPTGHYIRRGKETNFRPDKELKRYTAMYDWMDCLNITTNAGINHKMNSGKDFRLGPYLTDGYNAETFEVWKYLGCYFHGCSCQEWNNKEKQKERYEKSLAKICFMESKGYTVHTIWECEFKKQLKENDDLKLFVKNRKPTFYRKFPSSCTESDIMESVVNEDFFRHARGRYSHSKRLE